MRLLGGLGLAAPVLLIALLIAMPSALNSWVDEGIRSAIAAVAAGIVGVSLTSVLVATWSRQRLRRIIKVAERLGQGDFAATLLAPESGGGAEARLARAINVIATSMAATTDAATVDKLTGVSNRQTLLASLFSEVDRANRYGRPLSVAFVDIDHFKNVN